MGKEEGVCLRGSRLSTILWPAMAQSICLLALSIRRSRYQSFTDMAIVSVVSCASSGSHRSEMRVEKRQDELAGVLLVILKEMCYESLGGGVSVILRAVFLKSSGEMQKK